MMQKDSNYSRRQFLKQSLWTASSLFLAPYYLKANSSKHVVVVGAGLSGLITAYELKKRGFRVTVLEASSGVGGRVRTQRHFGGSPFYTELGATNIPETHTGVLKYAHEFGLTLKEISMMGPAKFFFGGEFFKETRQDGLIIPKNFPVTKEEREMRFKRFCMKYLTRRTSELGDPHRSSIPLEIMQAFDQETFAEYFTSGCASSGAIELLRGTFGSGMDYRNSFIYLIQYMMDWDWRKTYVIEGGNDLLPGALAKTLMGDVINYAVVTHIIQKEKGVSVRFGRRCSQQRIDADLIVMATPHKSLNKIEFAPALDHKKREGIEQVPMEDVIRANFLVGKRFWGGPQGRSVAKTDLRIEKLWDMTCHQGMEDQGGILAAYMQQGNAPSIRKLGGPKARTDFIQNEMALAYPQIHSQASYGHAWCWKEIPHIGGGWAMYGKDQMKFFPHLQKSSGRIFFAGDYTSLRVGWMEGAVESALRVVQEITS